MAEPEHPTPALTVRTTRASGLAVYKVLAGRSASLAEYNDACMAQSPVQGRSEEWRGLYTQFKRDHVLGTVPYRWERDQDTMVATLVKVSFIDDLSVVTLDGPMLHDGAVSGDTKAAAAKDLLGIDPEQPFIAALGERGQVCLVRETEDEWELVIPHALLPLLTFRESSIIHFLRHSRMPITHKWESVEDGGALEPPQRLWGDGAFPPAEVHGLVPDLV